MKSDGAGGAGGVVVVVAVAVEKVMLSRTRRIFFGGVVAVLNPLMAT